MDDLISRQSVLDAITSSINQFGGIYTTEQLNMWGLFTQMIQELPSAQPEIIRCKDCQNYRSSTPHGIKWCGIDGMTRGEDFYCGSAERRKNE